MPVVRPVDADRVENSCERVDFAQEVLRGEPALPQLLGQRVRCRGHRHPALDQLRQQPRDQRGVARVVQLELVDAHHDVVGQQFDALDEAENPGQLGELAERRERRRRRRRGRDRVVARRQQVGLADAEPAVEVEPDARQHLALAEQLLLARPPRHRLVAELQAGLHGRGLRRLGRIGPVAVEADVGEGRRRDAAGRSTAPGVTLGCRSTRSADTAGPVHAGTVATCCNRPHVRRRCCGAVHSAGPTEGTRPAARSSRRRRPAGRLLPLPRRPADVLGARQHDRQPRRRRDRRRQGGRAGRARRPRGCSRCMRQPGRRHPGRRGHRARSRTTPAHSSVRRSARRGSAAARPRSRPSPSSPTAASSTTTPSSSPAPRCRR